MSFRQDNLFFPGPPLQLLPFPSGIRGLIGKDRAQERTGSFSAAERRRTCRQSAGTRFAWVGAAGQVAHSGAASGLPLQTGWMRTTSASSPPVRPRPRALPSMLLPHPAALPPQPNGCTAWQLRGRPSVDSPVRPCQPPRPPLGCAHHRVEGGQGHARHACPGGSSKDATSACICGCSFSHHSAV